MIYRTLLKAAGAVATLTLAAGTAAQAQTILTNSNGIIRNSLCVGGDCQSGISFSDSTVILKENNTRIKFADTSGGSFPSGDWEIEANSSTNGGQSYLGFNDCGTGSVNGGCATDLVFAVETGAPTSALYVESDGDVGFGTSNPVVDLHAIDGNTPTLRLEQNTSSGFTAQTWDLAGNEANFFVRDVTGGSTLPFRIRPGAATSVIDIQGNERVGVNTASPDATMEVNATASSIGTGNVVMKLTNPVANGAVTLQMASANTATNLWNLVSSGNTNNFLITRADTGNFEFQLSSAGNLTLAGDLITGGSGNCAPPNPACDAVFDAGAYTVPSIEDHASQMWENGFLPAVGPTGPGQQVNVADKMLRMLNELEHAHIYIEQLNARIKFLEEQVADKG